MKLTITLACLLLTVTGSVLAGEVTVQSIRRSPAMEVVERGFDTCANAFAERIFPGRNVKFSTRLNVNRRQAEEAAYYNMVFTMIAQLKRDNSQLAKADCTVRTNGRVTSMAVRIAPAAQFAALKPNDVKLALVSR